jgi:S-DNA-T family DNA segregation ATPase FtsK/SpoIIIE
MNAAAKSSSVRLFVAVAALLTGIVNLLGALVRLVGALVASLTAAVQTWGAARAKKAPASVPAVAARPWVAPMSAPAPAHAPAVVPPVVRSRVLVPTICEAAPVVQLPARRAPYRLPSPTCLTAVDTNAVQADQDKLQATAATLVETLGQYGVQGKVEDILPGPTVTTYEMSLAAGTKVSKVTGLVDDMALALGGKVRILAPIPGKNRIGFEVPNDKQAPVALRDLIEDHRFGANGAALPIVLGRDSSGAPIYADLAAMPHVIVAGATGAGKSVGLNVMLMSLLYRRTPEQLKLIMIDPKVVELAPFNKLPHLLCPVITDMDKAATALQWAVDEMERRYQLLGEAGARNISSYNDKVSAAQKLPWIVIVVDEFADLVMQHGDEVEKTMARLAQKARAAGMHVILATQRPSRDVITGIIKANFPSRIAFRVSQRENSGIILGEQGAEHLLGKGDMLVKLSGASEAVRVQCPWVSENEVQAVTDFIRSQGEPRYDSAVLGAQSAVEAPVNGRRRGGLRVVA